MLSLIVISATVLIVVAFILFKSAKSLASGNGVLITKSIFSNKYKVKPEGGVIIKGIINGFVTNKINFEVESSGISSACSSGSGFLNNINYKISVQFDLDNLNIMLLKSDESVVHNLVNQIVISNIKDTISKNSLDYVFDNTSSVISDIESLVVSELDSHRLIVNSLFIDITSNNRDKYESLYREIPETKEVDRVELARKAAREEVEIAKINQSKYDDLNSLEISKKTSELNKQSRLKELEIQSNLKSLKLENEESSKEEDYRHQQELTKIKNEKDEMINKLSATNEVEELKIKNEKSLNKSKKELELDKIFNDKEVSKSLYESEKELHEDKIESRRRELELELKLTAEMKAEVKLIDTNSSITNSKTKLEYKKHESEVLASIKESADQKDIELYEKMMSVASSQPDLAIKWKEIESNIKIAQVNADALSKLQLDNIIVNGSTEDGIIPSIPQIIQTSSKENSGKKGNSK